MLLSRVHEPARRAFLLFAVVLIVYSAIFVARGVRGPGSADGYYAYLYARSLAFDHDLDFANDYALCGDPWKQGIDRGTGHLDNPGYPGPAVFWAPLLAAGRVLVHLPSDASPSVRAGCVGPLANFALSLSMPIAALAIVLAYLTARRFARAGPAISAALLFAFASSLPQYASIFGSSSHAYQCFAAALLLWASVRAREEALLSRWALVGSALGLCVLQRLSDAGLIFLPLAFLIDADAARGFKLRAFALVVVGGAVGVVLTLALYRHLYGSPFVLPQGRHYVHLDHAHPWLLLFAPTGGLFFTTPIAYLGVGGIALGLASSRYRLVAGAAALSFLVCLWISSAPLDWSGKMTFGARRLVVLTPLFVVFGAIALQRAEPLVRRHRSGLLTSAAVVLFGAPVLGGVLGTTTGETALELNTKTATYGEGVRTLFHALDESVPDLAVLPAEVFYAVRFGQSMKSFRAATTDRYYRRSFRDLSWDAHVLRFTDSDLREASVGARAHERGLELTTTTAKIVFTAGWPYATSAALDVSTETAATIGLRLGTTFGGCDLGDQPIGPGSTTVAFRIPAGCFDSGLVELRAVTNRAGAVVLERLVLDDETPYAPPY